MSQHPAMSLLGICASCFLGLVGFGLTEAQDPGQNSLRFVHAVWRHGDRTPLKPFRTDPNQATAWPEGPGELTKIGMRQHYRLGQFLRKRYIDSGFLSKDYNSTEIHVRASGYNRTIMSALSNLAGMYPPQPENIWLEGMTWQPIPVHSTPKIYDPMLWMERPCPTVRDVYGEVMRSPEMKKVMAEHANFYNYLRNVSGEKLNNPFDILDIYDPLVCEHAHNKTWAPWVTQEIFDKIVSIFNKMTTFYAHDPRLQRLRGGLLLGDIATRFASKAKKSPLLQPPALKYYVYSVHDNTMIVQMEALGAFDGLGPPYASTLLYELHEKTPGSYTVELYYVKDQGATEPIRLSIRECGTVCPLDTFVKIAASFTPSDWYAECGLGNVDPVP